MNEQQIKVNIKQFDILAPVISAALLNTLKTSELIAMQKGQPFDEAAELKKIINQGLVLTTSIQKNLMTSTSP